MAITANTLIDRASDTSNILSGAAYTTASIAPTANRLVLLAVTIAFSAGTPTVTPTGGGITTWDQVATRVWDTNAKRISVFRALQASPSSGTVSLTVSGDAIGAQWSIVEFDGVDTSGTNGSGAIVQSASESDANIALAAFADAVNNATYGAFGGTTNAAATEGTGFTLIGTQGSGTPSRNILTEWRLGEDTSVDASGLGTAAGIAIEIKAAVAASGHGPLLGRRRFMLVRP